MSIQAVFECIGLIAGIVAAVCFLIGRSRPLGRMNRTLCAVLFSAMIIASGLDFVEQISEFQSLDFIEDYSDLLVLAIWAVFLVSLLPARSDVRSQGGMGPRAFTRQLTGVFLVLIALNIVLSLSSFTKARDTLDKVEDYHGPSLVALNQMRSRANNAIQEAFAYVISGESVEKVEFENWASGFSEEADEFSLIARLNRETEGNASSAFKDLVASQQRLVAQAERMFSDYESKRKVSSETFRAYETIIDEIGDDFARLEQIEKSSYDSAQASVAESLENASFELPILGATTVGLSVVLFGLLVWSFQQYTNEQQFIRNELAQGAVRERRISSTLRHRNEAIQMTNTPIVFIDTVGRITEANQSFVDLFRIESIESVIGKPNAEFPSKPIPVSRINEIVFNEGEFSGEITTGDMHGTPIVVQVAATRFTDDDNQPVGAMVSFTDVTSQRKVEQALRESEQHYRTLVESAPEAIIVLDVDSGRFEEVNASATELFGIQRERLLSIGPNQLSPERQPDGSDSEQQAMQYVERALNGETPTFEWVHIDSAGNEIQCEIRLTRLASSRRLVRGSMTNITERKKAEQAERNLGRIVEESLNEIYIFNANSLVLDNVNRGARENLGYAMEELGELTILDLQPELTPHEFAQLVEPLRRGDEEVVQWETQHRRKDGSRYHVQVRLQAANYRGAPSFVAMVLDISERIKLESTLASRALEAELLHKSAIMADDTHSLDAALQKCVNIVCEMIRWPVGHVYVPADDGRERLEPMDIWHLSDAATFRVFRDVSGKTEFAMGEGLPGRVWKLGSPAWIADVREDANFLRNRLSNNLGVCAGFGVPIKIAGETIAILEFFHTDIIERNETLLLLVRSVGEQVGRVLERRQAAQAEQRRRELVEFELQQAKGELVLKTRLAAVGQVSAQVAHEMRNPLGAVSNAVFYLRRKVPAGEQKWIEYLDLIDGEISTCNRFIGELLDVTRGKTPQLASTDLGKLIDRALSRHPIPAGVSVRIDCRPDPFEVTVDSDQLLQVIDNLVKNSLDALDGDPGSIEIRAQNEGQFDTITIRDSGKGVDASDRDSIFDVLFTTKPTGTGLGLPICRQIIERHGGTIDLVDLHDPGTTFRVRLQNEHVSN